MWELIALAGLVMYRLTSYSVAYFGVDWRESFYPAVSLLLQGVNPYFQRTVFAPVWSLALLAPLSLFGWSVGVVLIFMLNFSILVFVLYRLKVRPIIILLVVLSPMSYWYLRQGNLDSFVLLGTVLPPPYSFLFLATKPQIGIMAGLYQVYALWRERGWLRTLLLCLPACVAIAANLLLIYLSPPRVDVVGAGWNVSMFPWSIPLGLGLLYLAWKKEREHFAIASSPFFSPYLQFGSWIIAFLAVTDNVYLTFGIMVMSWAWFLTHF